jgi:hypothetical protein
MNVVCLYLSFHTSCAPTNSLLLTTMWLLNTKTITLMYFADCEAARPYAILSHCWSDNEQSFQDIQSLTRTTPYPTHSNDPTYRNVSWKIRNCCRLALSLGYERVWIDTCCIDKSSSAELSETINSMFQWYQRSSICIAHLSGVHRMRDRARQTREMLRSKWFKRGWTLQELIAPQILLFVSWDWSRIGTKASLAVSIAKGTGINISVLTFKRPLSAISVAQRMSWAANRQTTRVEDQAYSLLGIFGINMPTIYGEGVAAFRRLQEEIMKTSPDQTLFAWGSYFNSFRPNDSDIPRYSFRVNSHGALATSPSQFELGGRVTQMPVHELRNAASCFIDKPIPYPYSSVRHSFP